MLAGVFVPYEPTATWSGEPMLLPNWQHPLGTDMLGRDMLSRVITVLAFNLFGDDLRDALDPRLKM